ncbi:hypothetical protein B0H10DRAFT_2041886, partial [Mycena sp. CBHHK59/15]
MLQPTREISTSDIWTRAGSGEPPPTSAATSPHQPCPPPTVPRGSAAHRHRGSPQRSRVHNYKPSV